MAYDWRTEWPNVFARHADPCPARKGHRCTCGTLGYRASRRDPETGKRLLSPDFETVAEARAWLHEQQETLEAAQRVARGDDELGAVIEDFMAAAKSGVARDANGLAFSPQRIHELGEALGYVDGQLGTMSIQDVRRRHVQGLVDQLRLAGAGTDRIKVIVGALRALYDYAIRQESVDFSPVVQLSLRARGDSPARTVPTPAPPVPAHDRVGATMAATGPQPAPATVSMDGAGGASTPAIPGAAEQYFQALTPERVLWWTLLVIVVVSMLIAVVLAAESV